MVARIEYGEGEVYEGEWDGEGRRHGRGCLSFSDGSSYKGQFRAGLFHVSSPTLVSWGSVSLSLSLPAQGLGRLELAGGDRYEGEFQLGKFQGHGVYTSASGMTFQVSL